MHISIIPSFEPELIVRYLFKINSQKNTNKVRKKIIKKFNKAFNKAVYNV